METAIGVFASRDRAEEAIKELRQHLPEDSIVFLTRSESEATRVHKEFGTAVGGIAGGATGLYAGIVASLLVPGLGPVFAIGVGGAALLGLAGAGGGSVLSKMVTHNAESPTTPEEKCPEDVAFFREVLKEGRSLIVVRTESKELATTACGILDRLGLGMPAGTPAKMQTATRHVNGATVIDISGRITLGEGNVLLREMVRELMENGDRHIVLNLAEVQYMDSSGLGELVKTHTTVRNKGGQLRLVNLNNRVNELLQMTRLSAVFDIAADEAAAIQSLAADTRGRAVA
jgi:anti-sigma B factor antagonist